MIGICETKTPECHNNLSLLSEIIGTVKDSLFMNEVNPILFNNLLYPVRIYP